MEKDDVVRTEDMKELIYFEVLNSGQMVTAFVRNSYAAWIKHFVVSVWKQALPNFSTIMQDCKIAPQNIED